MDNVYLHLLSTTLQVSGSLVLGGEDTSGLNNVFSTSGTPWDVGWITLLVELDGLAVDNELVGVVGGDLTLEVTVGGVILQHVDLRGLLEDVIRDVFRSQRTA